GIELIDEKENKIGVALRPETHDLLVRKMYREIPFYHPTVMMRRAFLTGTGGYDPSLRNKAEDLDLWHRSYHGYRFHNLQEILVRYRIPQRTKWPEVKERTFVLARSAWREGFTPWRAFCVGRYLIASILALSGNRRMHFRRK
ncbi:MAG: hypothetical protein ACREBW_08475, partial [Candidatus Micrarchaeaceae archaeon]